jgi:hypothetical protein
MSRSNQHFMSANMSWMEQSVGGTYTDIDPGEHSVRSGKKWEEDKS